MRTRLNVPLGHDKYQVLRTNDTWPDHIYRTRVTAAAVANTNAKIIVDPACGDGSIVNLAVRNMTGVELIGLNDISLENTKYTMGLDWPVEPQYATMDVFEYLEDVRDDVDVIVLTEILEHLDNPDELLTKARDHAKMLIASSPLNETSYTNHEHVWGWDKAGYEQMLRDSGWGPTSYIELDLSYAALPYNFQIWTANKR